MEMLALLGLNETWTMVIQGAILILQFLLGYQGGKSGATKAVEKANGKN